MHKHTDNVHVQATDEGHCTGCSGLKGPQGAVHAFKGPQTALQLYLSQNVAEVELPHLIFEDSCLLYLLLLQLVSMLQFK